MSWFKKRTPGSQPVGMQPMLYSPLPTEGTRQDRLNWVYPQAVTQYGARVTNTWNGNQLPGPTNFIPGVPKSYAIWSIPRGLYNAPGHSQQFNEGYNIQGMTAVRNASLLYAINQAWLNRLG